MLRYAVQLRSTENEAMLLRWIVSDACTLCHTIQRQTQMPRVHVMRVGAYADRQTDRQTDRQILVVEVGFI